jgi:hypothetical protein
MSDDLRAAKESAQRIFEKSTSPKSMSRAAAELAKAGLDDDAIRRWAANMNKLYGTGFDRDQLSRCVWHGISSIRPTPEPEGAEPAPVAVSPELPPVEVDIPEPEIPDVPAMPGLPDGRPPVFQSAQELLAIAVDPKATKQRLAEIAKASAELGKRAEAFAGTRTTFERRCAKVRAELAERSRELDERAAKLAQREAEQGDGHAIAAKWRELYERQTGRIESVGSGGLTREYSEHGEDWRVLVEQWRAERRVGKVVPLGDGGLAQEFGDV